MACQMTEAHYISRFLPWCTHRTEVGPKYQSVRCDTTHKTSSLAGMIQKVGILTPNNVQQISFAYKMYKRCDDAGWTQSNAFKKAFCLDVDSIEFIGVWCVSY